MITQVRHRQVQKILLDRFPEMTKISKIGVSYYILVAKHWYEVSVALNWYFTSNIVRNDIKYNNTPF